MPCFQLGLGFDYHLSLRRVRFLLVWSQTGVNGYNADRSDDVHAVLGRCGTVSAEVPGSAYTYRKDETWQGANPGKIGASNHPGEEGKNELWGAIENRYS